MNDLEETFAAIGVIGFFIIIVIWTVFMFEYFEVVDRQELIAGKSIEVDDRYFKCQETKESKELHALKKKLEEMEKPKRKK